MKDMIERVEPEVYIIAPHLNEDFTQLIASEIAERTNSVYLHDSVKPKNAALIVELGGVWDRGPEELYIEDKTRTKAFKVILSFFFRTGEIDQSFFKTRLSKLCDSNYVRLELSNRLRYSAELREFFIYTVSAIVSELKKLLKD